MDNKRENIKVVPDLDALAKTAAEYIIEKGHEAMEERGEYMLALSGGKTPRPIFDQLASRHNREKLHWSKVKIFWVDERAVPPEHPDSNFGSANERLLQHVNPKGVFRMQGEAEDPEDAAQEYEQMLQREFGLQGSEIPEFDNMLLGVGEDGHVASLFPGSSYLNEMERLVVAPYVSKLESYRISLTMPVLRNARNCLVIASGERKRWAVNKAFHISTKGELLPIQLLSNSDVSLQWLMEAEVINE